MSIIGKINEHLESTVQEVEKALNKVLGELSESDLQNLLELLITEYNRRHRMANRVDCYSDEEFDQLTWWELEQHRQQLEEQAAEEAYYEEAYLKEIKESETR